MTAAEQIQQIAAEVGVTAEIVEQDTDGFKKRTGLLYRLPVTLEEWTDGTNSTLSVGVIRRGVW